MLKKYINEEWNWAILIFMNAKCLLEADGYLETTSYLFNDKGIDPLTGDKKTIPIYHQIENIDIQHPLAYKQIQNNCFEKLADGFLIIGQYTDDEEDVEKIFCNRQVVLGMTNRHGSSLIRMAHAVVGVGNDGGEFGNKRHGLLHKIFA